MSPGSRRLAYEIARAMKEGHDPDAIAEAIPLNYGDPFTWLQEVVDAGRRYQANQDRP